MCWVWLYLMDLKKVFEILVLKSFALELKSLKLQTPTLYNVILRIARNLLETKENIKIESHPFYHIICDWFSWGWSKKINIFFEKKIQNGRLKKTEFFKIANSQIFFLKISWIGPWVNRIDWCKGHWFCSTNVAVRLADISSKMA